MDQRQRRVPQFTGVTTVDLQVPCTFDFSVATTKYFNGLADGDIPVCLMFSGTVFYADTDGALQVAPISWDKETKFRLPLKVWKDMMDAYYPNSAWLCLRRDVFEELHRFKVERGIPTWEQAFEMMLGHSQGRSGAVMNLSAVEKIANAVLYEGYILYPYRPFGGEESAALQFRSSLSTRILRPSVRLGSLGDEDRMPGRGRCRHHDRSEGAVPANG